jgi:DNA-binding NtrC family response regulator
MNRARRRHDEGPDRERLRFGEQLALVRRSVSPYAGAPTNGSFISASPASGSFGLHGDSDAMRDVRRTLALVARTDLTVLITGESGTGKSLAARAVHDASARRNRPFVVLDCANLPHDVTAAIASAEGGTVLFEEIADLSPQAQTDLLLALTHAETARALDPTVAAGAARLVATSHRALELMMAHGRMREDLLYRLRVVTVSLPALREHVADIPMMMDQFLLAFASRHAVAARTVDAAAIGVLVQYSWPGNVRELRNAIESALVNANEFNVSPRHLPADLWRHTAARDHPVLSAMEASTTLFVEAREQALREFDRAFLGAALAKHGGNVAQTARALGLHRQSLQKLLVRRAIRATGGDTPTASPTHLWIEHDDA